MAASATFALKAGVWFRRGRLDMVSPDSQATACLPSGRNSTYRPVQISATGSHLGISPSEFEGYISKMRAYRDKFLAHLDDLNQIDIPLLDRALTAVNFYHRHIVQHEAT